MKHFLIVFLFLSQPGFGQLSSVPGESPLSAPQLNHDIDVLIQAVESIHPNATLFSSEESIKAAEKQLRGQSAEGLSTNEFHILVRKYLRKLSCGHTVARPSAAWYKSIKEYANLLPFSIYLIDDKAYIDQAFDQEYQLKKGMQILKIESKDLSEILADMISIQERDGRIHSYEQYRIERLFRTYYLFLYGQNPVYHMTVLNLDGKEEMLIVKPGEYTASEEHKKPEYLVDIEMKSARFFIDPVHPKIGVLDIDRFGQKKYNPFYKKVFQEIRDRQLNQLVIDLRNNGGGYFPNGNHLLKYLLDEKFYMHFNRPKTGLAKPKEAKLSFFSRMTNWMFSMIPDRDKEDPRRNYALGNKPKTKLNYNGTLYVLIDGGTFSLASYVSTYLKKFSEAVFIGTETGGGEFGSNAVIEYELTLPESQIRINLPFYFMDHKMPKDEHFGHGVMPDHPMHYSIEDLLHERDLEMEKVFELVNGKQ